MLLGACDADLLDGVLCRAQSRRIEKPQGDARDADLLLDDVTRRARHVGDDGALHAEEGVEEARFADVRAADDDGLDPVAQDAARIRPHEQTTDGGRRRVDLRRKVFGGGSGDVILGEVDPCLDVCDGTEDLRADVRHRMGECTCEPLPCGTRGACALCCDQLHDALGAREVKPPMEKGALREFPRLCGTRAHLPCPEEHLAQDDRAAVTLQLCRILARIGVRRTHIEEDTLVDHCAVRRDDVSIARRIGHDVPERAARRRPKDAARNAERIPSAHADDADAARAVRGRDLADGVLGHGTRPFYHYLMHCAKKGCCTKVPFV